GALDNLVETRAEPHRADLQPVGRERSGRHEVVLSNLHRVDADGFGDLVDLNLEAESRLRRAVAAFRSARGFVGEAAHRVELVTIDVVGDGLQRARVEGRRDAVAAVRAAVDPRL